MKYRITWRHIGTGKVGRGKPIFSSQAVAEEVAVQMDIVWPEMEHWVEPAQQMSRPALVECSA